MIKCLLKRNIRYMHHCQRPHVRPCTRSVSTVRTGHSHWAKPCSSSEAADSKTESAQLNSEAESFSPSTVTLNQTHGRGSWLRAGFGGWLGRGVIILPLIFSLAQDCGNPITPSSLWFRSRRFYKDNIVQSRTWCSIRSVCRSHAFLK